ncbi:unnamed protein product (macronuclear) [Paramecium tetraurelia]|uniref:Uncharacterized protein n=1 Tax=Paramecium tetraurelia TaxID=5888 RepID=A0D1S1_PARTE|nr:uncharacterized protein GSPATT00012512001 [Paramecium tetraurelia]CAK76988.1 unnamed protein product [Paramecium tetraurelia]|eukprot:XP_001444385.1 hypothetical protein (macronuclear) [Paramecium tetraurelia strain d4-2]
MIYELRFCAQCVHYSDEIALVRRSSYNNTLTNNWCQAEADTDPNIIDQKSPSIKKKRQGRYKNVPYTFGRHFRNWIVAEVESIRCPVVQKFISKRKTNPRYHDSFKDFNELFQHSGIGRQLGQIFFGQKKWVQYLLGNERVDGFQIYFEVERSYYEAAIKGTKITEQKVRNL